MLFMIPTFVILFFLAYYPLGGAVYYSFYNWDLRSSRPMKFVGLDNYQKLTTDPRFFNSLKITTIWLITTVLGSAILGGGILAPLAYDYTKGSFRTLCLLLSCLLCYHELELLICGVLMYSPSIGIINYFLGFFVDQLIFSSSFLCSFSIAARYPAVELSYCCFDGDSIGRSLKR